MKLKQNAIPVFVLANVLLVGCADEQTLHAVPQTPADSTHSGAPVVTVGRRE
ncbi:MAG: hypothetical protein AAFX56_07600 [Pseudomonadota bacterium]